MAYTTTVLRPCQDQSGKNRRRIRLMVCDLLFLIFFLSKIVRTNPVDNDAIRMSNLAPISPAKADVAVEVNDEVE